MSDAAPAQVRLFGYIGPRRLLLCYLQFQPRDCWIGLFWRWSDGVPGVRVLHVYVCLVPLLPIHLTIGTRRP